MDSQTAKGHLAQIAFSVTDLTRTHDFYHTILGFEPAGGTDSFKGPITSQAQGLPDVVATCWWMVDQRDFMQLELFKFTSPSVRPIADDWRPCDIGYTTVGVHVVDYNALLVRLAQSGIPTLSPVLGESGSRRVCIQDPEGVLLELMEDDPRDNDQLTRERSELGVVTRSITASVPSLEVAQRFWVDTLGLEVVEDQTLHQPAHETLWDLDGAQRQTLLLSADDFYIELVQYDLPKGKAWPVDYRISDQGILNIALGYREMADLRRVHSRVLAAGYRCNSDLLEIGGGGCVYCNDDQGFSVELLCSDGPKMDEAVGFLPRAQGVLTAGRGLGGSETHRS